MNSIIPPAWRGIAFMVLAMLLFSLMNTCVRFSAEAGMPSAQLAFLRNALAMVMLLGWNLWRPSLPINGVAPIRARRGAERGVWGGFPSARSVRELCKSAHLGKHLTRAMIGVISMEIWFYSVGTMPLNEATALSFTAPLFATLFAMILLKEKATLPRWVALLVGFVGMLVILRPGAGVFSLPALLVLCSAMMMAFGGTLIKSLTQQEHPDKIVFFQALLMTPLALPAALYYWQPLSPVVFGWAVLVAIFSLTAHVSLTRAFAQSEMVVLMPFEFVRLVFTALLAVWWFEEHLDGYTALGALLIVAGSVWGASEGNPTVKRLLRRLMLKQEN